MRATLSTVMEACMLDLRNDDDGIAGRSRDEGVSLTAEVVIGVGLVLAFVLALILLHPTA
jgi:hypothetical protein